VTESVVVAKKTFSESRWWQVRIDEIRCALLGWYRAFLHREHWPNHRKEPTMIDRNEQRYHAAMFCWNMAIDAATKALRCSRARDEEGAQRWSLTVNHYLKNYRRLQYTDK
jgi:hypothetical protein